MPKRAWLGFAATVLAVLCADQLTKALARGALGVGDSVPVIPGLLWFTHVSNSGAAFGILQGQRLPLVLAAIAVAAAIAYALVELRPESTVARTSLGLVMGGALGNLVDRVASGGVTDFIDLGWFPVFNVADACLDVGAAILVLWLLFGRDRHVAKAVESPERGADAGYQA